VPEESGLTGVAEIAPLKVSPRTPRRRTQATVDPLIPKHRTVLGDELVEQRRFGPVAAVARRRDESLGLREVGCWRAHARIPAML